VKGWSVAGGGKVEKIEIDGKSWQTLPMDGSSRVFLAETGETVLNQLTPNFIRAGYTYTLSVDIGKSVGGTASDISKGISMAIYADMDGKTTQVAANTIKASDIGRNHLKF
jgi:hypothetical protein